MMNLPIDIYEERIVSSVLANDVTVICAETGAGKSLHVPIFLKKAGFSVCVTEPRRIAASSLAKKASEEECCTLGEKVGFATAFEQCYSEDTDILYVTDGLQLVIEINNKQVRKDRVLIIDEVHEWNLNVETLLAWSKVQMENGWNTKLVIMSATMDSSLFKDYFGESSVGVISAEGRKFDVEMFEMADYELEEVVCESVNRGENTLVFLPGKPEIEALMEALSYKVGRAAKILTLHGELSYEEQRECFKNYFPKVKVILATNVAQTSITLEDIDTVVDTGLEKRVESENGIESLVLRNVSKADILQRKGRAGRTKAGKYYLCSDVCFDMRQDYTIPEILRLNLETVILRLSSAGIDAWKLKFVHQPNFNSLYIANKLLRDLGAIDTDGKITSLGRKMSNLPLNARFSRMAIEAKERKCLESIIPIVAILQNGTLLNYKNGGQYRSFSSEHTSDLLAELDVFNHISSAGYYIDFKEYGINGKVYGRVKEYVGKLKAIFKNDLERESTEKLDHKAMREAVRCCIITGMPDLLFKQKCFFFGNNIFCNDDFEGFIGRGSVVSLYMPEFIIGIPNTITRGDGSTVSIINFATRTSINQMLELAPLLVKKESLPDDAEDKYSVQQNKVMEKFHIMYKDKLFYTVYEMVEDESVISAVLEKEMLKLEKRLSSEEQGKENKTLQDIMTINGRGYNVFYPSGSPYILMDLARLFELEEKSLYLYDGTRVSVECEGKRCADIDTLKTQVKSMLITTEAKDLKAKILEENLGPGETTIGLEETSKLIQILPEVGKRIVSYSEDGVTLSKEVFFTLVLKENRVYLEIYSEQEPFLEKTTQVLKLFFEKVAAKRFPDSRFLFKINGKRTLTKKGSAAKAHFEKEKKDVLKGLTTDNFSDSLEYLELVYMEALDMLETA